VPWAFIDLVILLGIGICVSMVFAELNHRFHWLPDSRKIKEVTLAELRIEVIEGIAIRLFMVVVGLSTIALRTGARLGDLGFIWQRLVFDTRSGLVGFIMVAPPVYALQGVLVFFWKESKHPIIEMFKAEPDARLFGLLVVSAAIVAPLFEEFIFRVLVQGFLEKMWSAGGDIQAMLLGDIHSSAPQSSELQPPLRGLASFLPIAITSAIFALLHVAHGPDWIPLFFLSLGLGYLYQRTHSVVPSLVVHALLNAMSMWGVWVTVKQGLSS